MKRIAIIGVKAGSGKTTTAFELAYMLSLTNRRVLLMDLDPKGDLTKSAINLEDVPEKLIDTILKEAEPPNTLDLPSKLLPNGQVNRIYEVLPKPDKALSHISSTLALIPSNPCGEGLTAVDLNLDFDKEKGLIRDLLFLYGNDYDYCIIDTSENTEYLTLDAMNAADSLILTAKAESASIEGLEEALKRYERVKKSNPYLKIAGILITDFDRRPKFYKEYRAKLVEQAKAAGIHVFKWPIRHSSRLPQAFVDGKSVYQLPERKISEDKNGNSILTDYRNLFAELMAIEEGLKESSLNDGEEL